MVDYDMAGGRLRREGVEPATPAYAREVEYAGWVPELAMVAAGPPGHTRQEPPPAVAWGDIDRLLRRLEGR
jgi:hypothetical protein